MTTERQLSRVAGVPRLKLPIWKAAAAQFFPTGKDPSRDEQRNSGKKTKVALLRELAASDPAVRSWVIKFATDFRARDARQVAAEQGFVMPEKLGFVALFPGDRPDLTVADREMICMNQPNAEELLAKLATLYPDGDPPHVQERQAKEWADFEKFMAEPQPVTHGCNFCGKPATRQITIAGRQHHFCNDHDGRQGQPVPPPPPDPQSPAVYINSDYGKATPDAIINAQRAEADAARSYDRTGCEGRPMVGPVSPNSVFLSAK